MRKLTINFESLLNAQDVEVLHEFFPMQTLVSFDLETSGFSPHLHEILEIGACAIESYQAPRVTHFHELIKNTRPIAAANTSVHGLSAQDLESSADVGTVLQAWKMELNQLLLAPSLLAHNAIFDLGHVFAHGHKANIFCFPDGAPVYDSCILARKLFKKKHTLMANAKLSTLAQAFDVELTQHHALSDAWACALVFLRMLALAKKEQNISSAEILSLAYLCNVEDLKRREIERQSEDPNPIVQNLLTAIQEGSVVEIIYQSGSKGKNFRPIRPISIVPSLNGMILFADCLLDQTGKHFQIQKISAVQTSEQAP
jgi:DNA polymerase III epsilon subunit-like protein